MKLWWWCWSRLPPGTESLPKLVHCYCLRRFRLYCFLLYLVYLITIKDCTKISTIHRPYYLQIMVSSIYNPFGSRYSGCKYYVRVQEYNQPVPYSRDIYLMFELSVFTWLLCRCTDHSRSWWRWWWGCTASGSWPPGWCGWSCSLSWSPGRGGPAARHRSPW